MKENKEAALSYKRNIQTGDCSKSQRLNLSLIHSKKILDLKKISGLIPANPSYIETKKRDIIFYKFDV